MQRLLPSTVTGAPMLFTQEPLTSLILTRSGRRAAGAAAEVVDVAAVVAETAGASARVATRDGTGGCAVDGAAATGAGAAREDAAEVAAAASAAALCAFSSAAATASRAWKLASGFIMGRWRGTRPLTMSLQGFLCSAQASDWQVALQ